MHHYEMFTVHPIVAICSVNVASFGKQKQAHVNMALVNVNFRQRAVK